MNGGALFPQGSLPVNTWGPGMWGVSMPSGRADPGAHTPIPGVERSAGPGIFTSVRKAYHPDNPMFWVGALVLATFGLIAGATELRVGSARAGVSLGDTKKGTK